MQMCALYFLRYQFVSMEVKDTESSYFFDNNIVSLKLTSVFSPLVPHFSCFFVLIIVFTVRSITWISGNLGICL